jgi:hypothetical protein
LEYKQERIYGKVVTSFNILNGNSGQMELLSEFDLREFSVGPHLPDKSPHSAFHITDGCAIEIHVMNIIISKYSKNGAKCIL